MTYSWIYPQTVVYPRTVVHPQTIVYPQTVVYAQAPVYPQTKTTVYYPVVCVACPNHQQRVEASHKTTETSSNTFPEEASENKLAEASDDTNEVIFREVITRKRPAGRWTDAAF